MLALKLRPARIRRVKHLLRLTYADLVYATATRQGGMSAHLLEEKVGPLARIDWSTHRVCPLTGDHTWECDIPDSPEGLMAL